MADETVLWEFVTRFTSHGLDRAVGGMKEFNKQVEASGKSAEENRKQLKVLREEARRVAPEFVMLTDSIERYHKRLNAGEKFGAKTVQNYVDQRDRLRDLGDQLRRTTEESERATVATDKMTAAVDRQSRSVRLAIRDQRVFQRGWERFSTQSTRRSISGLHEWATTLATIVPPAIPQILTVLSQAIVAVGGAAVGAAASLAPLAGGFGAVGAAASLGAQGLLTWNFAMKDMGKLFEAALFEQDADKFATAMEKFSPTAQKFADTLRKDVRPAVVATQEAMQKNIFAGMTEAMDALKPRLPIIQQMFTDTSKVFGDFIGKLGKEMGNDEWARAFQIQSRRNIGWMEQLSESILPVAGALRDLMLAGAPVVDWAVKLTGSLARQFANWVKVRKAAGDLTKDAVKARDRLKDLWSIGTNLIKSFVGITKAAQDFGDWIVTGLKNATGAMSDWVNSFEGQSRIKEYFENIKPAVEETSKLLVDLGGVFLRVGEQPGLANLAKQLRTDVLPVLERLMIHVNKELGPVFVTTFTEMLKAFTALMETTTAARVFLEALTAMSKAVSFLADKAPWLLNTFVSLFAAFRVARLLGLAPLTIGIIKAGRAYLGLGKSATVAAAEVEQASARMARASATAATAAGRAGAAGAAGAVGAAGAAGAPVIINPRTGQPYPPGPDPKTRVPWRTRLAGGLKSQTGRTAAGGVIGAGLVGASMVVPGGASGVGGAALQMGGTGAMLGMMGGPWGAAIGGLAGAAIGATIAIASMESASEKFAKNVETNAGRFKEAADKEAAAREARPRARLELRESRRAFKESETAVAGARMALAESKARGDDPKVQAQYRRDLARAIDQEEEAWRRVLDAKKAVAEIDKAQTDAQKEQADRNKQSRNQLNTAIGATGKALGEIERRNQLMNKTWANMTEAERKAFGEKRRAELDKLRDKLKQIQSTAQEAGQTGIARIAGTLERIVAATGKIPKNRTLALTFNGIDAVTGQRLSFAQIMKALGPGASQATVSNVVRGGTVAPTGFTPRATGGRVTWGVPNADQSPAMLSKGEFVVTRHGESMLEQMTGQPGVLNWLEGAQAPHFAAGGRVTMGQMKGLAKGAGIPRNQWTNATAIGWAESGGNIKATNKNTDGSIDRGLWQINSIHSRYGAAELFTGTGNARAMAGISSKGTNWRPWVAYTSGAYKRHLTAAGKADVAGGGTVGSGPIPLQNYLPGELTRSTTDALRAGFSAGLDPNSRGLTDIMADFTQGGARGSQATTPGRSGGREFYNPGIIPANAPPAVKARLKQIKQVMSQVDAHNWPYAVGGGHGNPSQPSVGPHKWGTSYPRVKGFDCSGAVSYAMQQGGFNTPTKSSGQWLGYGEAGKGKYITIWAKPGEGKNGHVYLEVLKQAWGTARSNDQGGPGWISSYTRPGFTARHPKNYARGGRVGGKRTFATGGRNGPYIGTLPPGYGAVMGTNRPYRPAATGYGGFSGATGRVTGAGMDAAGGVAYQNAFREIVVMLQKASFDAAMTFRAQLTAQINAMRARLRKLLKDPKQNQGEAKLQSQINRLTSVLEAVNYEVGFRIGRMIQKADAALAKIETEGTRQELRGRIRGIGPREALTERRGFLQTRLAGQQSALKVFQQALARALKTGDPELIAEARARVEEMITSILETTADLADNARDAIRQAAEEVQNQLARQTQRRERWFDLSQRSRGIDPGSAQGLQERGGFLQDQLARQRAALGGLSEQLAAARANGDKELIKELVEQYEDMTDDIYESTVAIVENARDVVKRTSEEMVEKSDNALAAFETKQRAGFTSDTAAGLLAKAEYYRDVYLPGLQAALAILGAPPVAMQTGGIVNARQNGTPIIVGEAGFDEVVLTTDPKHKERTDQILSRFLKQTGRVAATGKYWTTKAQVQGFLGPGDKIGFTPGKGYYVIQGTAPAGGQPGTVTLPGGVTVGGSWGVPPSAGAGWVAPTNPAETATSQTTDSSSQQQAEAPPPPTGPTVDPFKAQIDALVARIQEGFAVMLGLFRDAVRQASQEFIDAAGHITKLRQFDLQKLELEQRIAGTFDTGGFARREVILTQIIPALQNDLQAINDALAKARAETVKDAKYIAQREEEARAKEIEILQAQLDAQELGNEQLNKLNDNFRGISIGFEFAGQSWTDILATPVGT